MIDRAAPGRATARAGFTLIEVMVALVILAVLAGMAFRGVDALMRAKDRTKADTERTLRLDNGIGQFDADIAQIVNTQVVDPATFDGATLRLTRRGPGGLQLVVWTLQDHRWQRWASPPMTHVADLQEAWLRSQQWSAIAPNALTVLEDVRTFQVYSYCAGGGWGNFQSSCGTVQTQDGNLQGGNDGPGNGNGNGTQSSGTGASSAAAADSSGSPGTASSTGNNGSNTNAVTGPGNGAAFPTGIRIQLGLTEGSLSRERELPTL